MPCVISDLQYCSVAVLFLEFGVLQCTDVKGLLRLDLVTAQQVGYIGVSVVVKLAGQQVGLEKIKSHSGGIRYIITQHLGVMRIVDKA